MKRLFTTAALALVLATPAIAADVTIAVGQPGRGYEAKGKEVAARLNGQHAVTVVNYEGSDDISRAVCDGKAMMGIMQIDAIYTRQKEGCKLRVIGSYGEEFAYLMVPPKSKIDELHDLDGSSKILVDTIGSGTDLFWHTIVSIETGEHGNVSTWSKATAVNDFAFLADAMADAGDIDAALFVTTPTSAEIKELLDAGWELAEINDKDINDELHNGDSLYPRKAAPIAGTGGWLSGDTKEDSYVVRSFFVVGESATTDRRLFADIALAVKTVAK